MSREEIFQAFAAPPPGAIEYCDFVDADPPPRELGRGARRYVRINATYVWAGLLICFQTLPSVITALLVPRIATIGWALATLALTVWLVRATAAKRARLRKIAVDGRQAPGRVLQADELVYHHGLATARRVTLVLDVEGRRVTCRSWAGDLEGVTRGAWLRVLTHADVPDVVIPVVNVT